MQWLVIEPDSEKVIECYVDANFTGGRNEEEGKDLGLVLYLTVYVSTYVNWPIIWANQQQTEI